MGNPSKVGAILACRCPRCRRGEVFTHSFLNLNKFDQMHKSCPVCGLWYEVEVGLFWGAMYISYGFSVGIVLAVGILLYYFANDPPTWVYVVVVAVVVLLSTTLLFRYARILMLYYFSGINYDPSYKQQ
ncbi:DUF983 domain-containing protein [Pontibacter silvestris]|uniref:DUF983 domain-containing protein n=1 Tax=Pontibacter silvestris TaxID=2305183 RepID=A0ABW4X2M2_9BACT|nr:DUF983 domain-containing protein [Pontibacter silvestris]MCC9138284.1 DUF983 domain-containing protein [Pontibacter silvestris]